MEPPESFEADAVRTEKLKVWRSIKPIGTEAAVRGQYGPGEVDGRAVVGYRQEDRVNPQSNTETYAAVRLELENWRWAGVPFYLRAGKRLNRRVTEIKIVFKQPPTHSFRMKEGGERFEIVGVCAEAKYAWIRDEAPPTFYVLYTQQKDAGGSMTYEVRTKGDPKESVSAVREVVESVDKDLPLIDVRTQQEQIDAALAPERSFATVTTGFGVLALVLASIGVYGVIAAGVSRRVNEIGVRMALGARAEQVFRMVLGEAIGLALGGVVAGLCAALLLSRLLTSMLFGLKPTDSVTLATAGLLLSIAALFAAWVPARRAFPHCTHRISDQKIWFLPYHRQPGSFDLN